MILKRTLINLLLNRRKARKGIGLSTILVAGKYLNEDYPISFQDTPGYRKITIYKKS